MVALFDRVKETTTTSGSGTITLAGAVSGFQSFSGVYSDGETTYYTITNGAKWEVGVGTYTGGTLSRDTVLDSNTGSRISLVGTSTVFVTYPAGKSVYRDLSDRAVVTASGIYFSDGTTQTTAAVDVAATGQASGIAFFDGTTYLTASDMTYSSADEQMILGSGGIKFDDGTTQSTAASSAGLVPYVGATGTVNLGSNDFYATSGIFSGNISCGAISFSGALPRTAIDYMSGLYITEVRSGWGVVHYADLHTYRGINGAAGRVVYSGMTHGFSAQGSASEDIKLSRYAAGHLSILGDSGVRIRDYDDTIYTDLSCAAITASGNLIFSTDNAFDIGANGATRPRTGYFGTRVSVAGYGTGSVPAIDFGGGSAGMYYVFPGLGFKAYGSADVAGVFNNGFHLPSNNVLSWASTSTLSYASIDTKIARYATGPAVQVQASGGLRIRDLADSTYAPLDCGTITASGVVTLNHNGPHILGTNLEMRSAGGNGYINNRIATGAVGFNGGTWGNGGAVYVYGNGHATTPSACRFYSSSYGNYQYWLNSGTTVSYMTLHAFGGETSAYSAIKPSGTTLQIRLADDSADASLTAASGTFSGDVLINGTLTVSDGTRSVKVIAGHKLGIAATGPNDKYGEISFGSAQNHTFGASGHIGKGFYWEDRTVDGASQIGGSYNCVNFATAGAKLFQWKAAGVEKAHIDVGGNIIASGDLTATSGVFNGSITSNVVSGQTYGVSVGNGITSGLGSNFPYLQFVTNWGTKSFRHWAVTNYDDSLTLNGDFYIDLDHYMGFSSGAAFTAVADTKWYRDAAGILAQRNSTNPQTFRLYKTYTSATNAEWVQIQASGSSYNIGSMYGTAGGSGVPIQIGHFSDSGVFTDGLTVNTTGNHTINGASGTGSYPLSIAYGGTNVYRFAYNGIFSMGMTGNEGILNVNSGFGHITTTGATSGTRHLLIKSYNSIVLDVGGLGGSGTKVLAFSGTTSSEPAIKPSGTTLQFRLGDDSGYCNIAASGATFNGVVEMQADSSQKLTVRAVGAAASINADLLLQGKGAIGASRVFMQGGSGGTAPNKLFSLRENGVAAEALDILAGTTAGNGIRITATGGMLLGTDTATGGKLQVRSTTEQLRLEYDASNVTSFTVDSSGNLDIAPSGGTVNVDGAFTATSKSFLIDHPSHEGMKLQYACLEGPENGVYVRGTTDSSVIELPDYWVNLVHETSITVSLTPRGSFQQLFVEESNSTEVRVGGVTGSYDYVVYGTRKDIELLKVEV